MQYDPYAAFKRPPVQQTDAPAVQIQQPQPMYAPQPMPATQLPQWQPGMGDQSQQAQMGSNLGTGFGDLMKRFQRPKGPSAASDKGAYEAQ